MSSVQAAPTNVRRLNMMRAVVPKAVTDTDTPLRNFEDTQTDHETETGKGGWEIQRKQRQGDRKREERGKGDGRSQSYTHTYRRLLY